MTDIRVKAGAAALLILALSGCALHGATSGRVVLKDEAHAVDVEFSRHDRDAIRRYYSSSNRKSLPPGLAKRGGNLPPGLAKRERLPPGLQTEALPRELERQLSALAKEYIRVRIGGDIVLMDRRTRVVLDVVYDIAN